MESILQRTTRPITDRLCKLHLWVVLVTMILLAIIHYHEIFPSIGFIQQIGSDLLLGLTRHTLERILFLIPVAYGAAMLSVRGGIITLIITAALLFPRVFLFSPQPREAFFETCGVVLIGALIISLAYALEKGKRRLIDLEVTKRVLSEKEKSQEEILRANRKLSALNHIAHVLDQSLDLGVILQAVTEAMMDILEVQVSWVRLSDDHNKILSAQASQGVSEETLDKLMKTISDTASSEDMAALRSYSLTLGNDTDDYGRSLCYFATTLLKSKGVVFGTAGIATTTQPLDQQRIPLLDVIGNQIAGAIERCKLYEEMQLARDVRGELLHTVITTQEDERKRIARELHDEIGQAFTALRLGLERLMLEETANDGKLKDQLQRYIGLCQQAEDDVDRTILDLRPTLLDDLGLVEATRFYANTRLGKEGVQVNVRVSGKERRLPSETESTLFRIMQESITNIAKHANAKDVTVDIQFETNRLILGTEDDGCGFEVNQLKNPQNSRHGLGLLGMRERMSLIGGSLHIISKPGIGTTIKAIAPIAREEIYR